ncbi:MAG: hypothetical protein V7782_05370 [Psychromonas sp.]
MVQQLTVYRTQIIVGIIILIAILGGAMFSIWDNAAAPESEQTTMLKSKYIISVYYYPSRESDAKNVKAKLEESGYVVNTYSGSDLNSERVISKSYMYYKENDHGEMIVLRDFLSSTLDEDFSVHISGADKKDKTMRVVLVENIE